MKYISKTHIKSGVKIALLSVLFLLLAVPASNTMLTKYYDGYESMEKSLQSSFSYDGGTANAIKHAKASADMYRALRLVMNDQMAEETVIRLGVLNEYIERVKYKEDRDSAREIMKDLHNNYVGIMAARAANRTDAFKIILAFADNRTLIVRDIYNPFFEGKEPHKHVVEFGYDWFDEHRTEIDERIERKLARAKDLLPVETVQLSNIPHKAQTVE